MIHRRILFATLITFLVSSPLTRAGPPNGDKETKRDSMAVVVRVSKEMFEDLTRHSIDMTVPVNRRVEQYTITGEANGKGVTDIELIESDEHAQCVISVTGTVVGRLRSDVGPAIARMTTRAKFRTEKTVRFDGDDFLGLPTDTTARNCSNIDSVCAKKRGPIGRIVEVIGTKIAKKSLPEVNLAAQNATTEILSDTMEKAVAELIAELNVDMQIGPLVDKYFPETAEWKPRLATRSNYMQAGFGPPASEFPKHLSPSDDEISALAEIWVRLTPGQAMLVNLMSDLDVGYDLLREYMPDEEARALADDIKIDRREEWTVISYGSPKAKE